MLYWMMKQDGLKTMPSRGERKVVASAFPLSGGSKERELLVLDQKARSLYPSKIVYSERGGVLVTRGGMRSYQGTRHVYATEASEKTEIGAIQTGMSGAADRKFRHTAGVSNVVRISD